MLDNASLAPPQRSDLRVSNQQLPILTKASRNPVGWLGGCTRGDHSVSHPSGWIQERWSCFYPPLILVHPPTKEPAPLVALKAPSLLPVLPPWPLALESPPSIPPPPLFPPTRHRCCTHIGVLPLPISKAQLQGQSQSNNSNPWTNRGNSTLEQMLCTNRRAAPNIQLKTSFK